MTPWSARSRLGAGERRYLSLAYTKSDPAVLPPLGRHAEERIADTIHWWREWAGRCCYTGPYREPVVRSAVTLKLLTYALSGAIVAAPTTSLPEAIGKGRNWDYRYCWLRDAGLTTQALLATGYRDEALAFLGWMLHATRLSWPELQVMYDVFGRTRLAESELVHLAGYAGSRPVRIGNDAYRQRQLDIYGEVVMAACAALAGNGRLDTESARMLGGLGDVVCRQWRESDSSIWEVRGPLRHYTFSKVMCWAALDGLLKLHDDGALALSPTKVEAFGRERAAIEQAIERRGFNAAIGSYASVLDGDKVDASLLLMACIGYKDAGDPRMRATYDRIHSGWAATDFCIVTSASTASMASRARSASAVSGRSTISPSAATSTLPNGASSTCSPMPTISGSTARRSTSPRAPPSAISRRPSPMSA